VSNSRALDSLEHCWTSSSSYEAFVSLGGLPPRCLGIAHKLPRCGELWDNLGRSCFASEREEAILSIGKRVECNPTSAGEASNRD
jgi:hypothetical protein